MEFKVCKLYHLYYIYFKEDNENIWWIENKNYFDICKKHNGFKGYKEKYYFLI